MSHASKTQKEEEGSDGGLNLIRQLRSSDPIYRKISTLASNEEVGRVAQGSKFGQEIMSCAFSPDGTMFAWSVGSSIVSVHTVSDLLSSRASTSGVPTPSLLENWPQVHNALASGRIQDAHAGKVDVDCGQGVTALAFGLFGDKSARRASEVKYSRFSTKGNLVLAAGLATGEIKIWDMATGKLSLLLQDHTDQITSLKFAPGASFILASASKDFTVKLWDMLDDGNMFRSLAPKEAIRAIKPSQVAFSPDAKRLASVGDGKLVHVWELENYTVEKTLQGHQNDVTGCLFSADGKFLYTSSFDTRVICWNVDTGEIVRKFEHMHPPPTAIFAAGTNEHEVLGLDLKQSRLATLCNDGFLRVWDLTKKDSEPVTRVEIVPDGHTLAFSEDEKCVAVGCQGGFLQFYELD